MWSRRTCLCDGSRMFPWHNTLQIVCSPVAFVMLWQASRRGVMCCNYWESIGNLDNLLSFSGNCWGVENRPPTLKPCPIHMRLCLLLDSIVCMFRGVSSFSFAGHWILHLHKLYATHNFPPPPVPTCLLFSFNKISSSMREVSGLAAWWELSHWPSHDQPLHQTDQMISIIQLTNYHGADLSIPGPSSMWIWVWILLTNHGPEFSGWEKINLGMCGFDSSRSCQSFFRPPSRIM